MSLGNGLSCNKVLFCSVLFCSVTAGLGLSPIEQVSHFISRSSQCSTTGIAKAVICVILPVG